MKIRLTPIRKETFSFGFRKTTPHIIPKGFTLVEVLVVVAIIGIIATISTPNLLSIRQKYRVRADARDVHSALRHAQTEAVKRSVSVGITFDPGTSEYTLFLDNGSGLNANNVQKDTDEQELSINHLRKESSFADITFPKIAAGFSSRGLPLTDGTGSLEIRSSSTSVLAFELTLNNAGAVKSEDGKIVAGIFEAY